MHFRSVRRRTIHEDVAAQLEEAIVAGTFVPGEQLPPERELMETFQVGRPAVREALLLLERMGLVQLSTGERARVTRPTVDGLVGQLSGAARRFLASPGGQEAFQDSRRVFEAAVARHAATVATPAAIERLRAALAANRDALQDMAAFERTDVAFHFAIAEAADNPVFVALHGAIVDWLALQRNVSLRVPDAAERAYGRHAEVFDAVARHDPERAWRAMDLHLQEVVGFFHDGQRLSLGTAQGAR
jgi:DNA-binding FadR family transcriptional regulator